MQENRKFVTEVIAAPGRIIANPLGIGNVLSEYTQEDELRYDYSQALPGEFDFFGSDYHYFKRINDSQKRYDDIRVNIYSVCENGIYPFYDAMYNKIIVGFISLKDATFDDNACRVKTVINVVDRYRDFDDVKGDEYNLFALTDERVESVIPGASYYFKNGLYLRTALFALLREALGVTGIKSNFFQWAPDDTGYTIGNSSYLHNLVIYQQSDILLSDEIGYSPATIFKMKLSDLIGDLCTLCNLKYQIDENNNFRIEHVSWFSSGVGLDLTESRYSKYINGKTKFHFDTPTIVRKEVFEMKNTANDDFVGLPIVYDNAFTRTLSKENSTLIANREAQAESKNKVYEAKVVATDISHIVDLNEDVDDNRKGAVLLALNSSNEVFKLTHILGGFDTWNNVLSWALLQDSFYKHNRLFKVGKMNGVEETFISTQPIKIQEPLQFPICCDETINLNSKVITQLGEGVIKRLSINRFKGTAEIEVAFEYNGTEIIDAPTAVNDNYATFADDVIDTAAESLPTLISNDIGATHVLAETKITSRSGTVIISGDGNFIYTPPTGEIGIDSFEYVALDVNEHADFGRVNIILKTEDVYIHIVDESSIIYIEPGHVPVTITRFGVYYYQDPTLAVPLDLTGYEITIFYKKTTGGVDTFHSFLAAGYKGTITAGIGTVFTVDLLPDSKYTIV